MSPIGPTRPFVDPAKLAGLRDDSFTAPDEMGCVEGWRAWRVGRELPDFGLPPKLHSVTYDYYWTPRQKARAECQTCGPDVPGEGCSCGFYSAKTLDHLRQMGYHTYGDEGGQVCVVGRLACWGKVVEGTQGWRTEYAYPAVLYLPFEVWRLGSRLAKAYGVPIKLLNLLDRDAQPGQARDLPRFDH